MKNTKIDLMEVTQKLSQINGVSLRDAMDGLSACKGHITTHQAMQYIRGKLNSFPKKYAKSV